MNTKHTSHAWTYTKHINSTPKTWESGQSINTHEKLLCCLLVRPPPPFPFLQFYLLLCLGGNNPESFQSIPNRSWWPSWRLCWQQQNLSRPDSSSPQPPHCTSSAGSRQSSWSPTGPSSMSAVCRSRSHRDIYTPFSWSASLPARKGFGLVLFLSG